MNAASEDLKKRLHVLHECELNLISCHIVCCCLLLSVVVCCCLLLSVVVCCCLLLFVGVCCGLLLSDVVCCCLLLFVGVCCGLLLFVVCCLLFVVGGGGWVPPRSSFKHTMDGDFLYQRSFLLAEGVFALCMLGNPSEIQCLLCEFCRDIKL